MIMREGEREREREREEERERERKRQERERREREREALLLKAPARSGLPSPFNSKDKATKTFFPWDGDSLVDSCTFGGGLWGGLVQKEKNEASPTPPCSW